jgi:hypothetical protein
MFPPNPCPSTLTCNAWNHTPSLKFNQENFPDLEGNVKPSRRHVNKKQHMELGSQSVNTSANDASLSPPSVGTTQTELTNERTEFQTTISNMQTSFAEELRKIKHDNDMIRQEMETRMKLTDTEYQSAQQSMLTEFKAIDTKYTTILESFSSLQTDLCNEQSVQDHRHMGMKQSLGAMMHILLNISQSLSAGTHPDQPSAGTN